MIRGKISCGELRVERRARVQFIHPVETGLAVINGQVIGSIRARSTVTLMRKSRITGNVAATELVMKRGAQHIGKFRLSEAAAAAPESTAATPETAD